MDRYQAHEPESRFVRWPWCGRAELVTLPRWYWWYFDRLAEKRGLTAETLHREISQAFPRPRHLWAAIYIHLDRTHERQRARHYGWANDNDRYHSHARPEIPRTRDERTRDRLNPPMPPVLPHIRYSPFKPIARAKRLFAEADTR